MSSPLRLGLFDSNAIIPIKTVGPGTFDVKLFSQGNSLISTLFIESLDPGATIKVNYWDFGVGEDAGERVDLQSHKLFTGPLSVISDRITVTRIHDKPVVEVIVTGGNATFGVYVSVVSSFASDSDAALVLDQQVVDLALDKGNPKGIYDPVQGKWYLARGQQGVQDVHITGGNINVTMAPFIVKNVLSGSATDLPFGSSTTIFDYTASAAFVIGEILCGGDSDGEFNITINGIPWGMLRNSYHERQVALEPAGPIQINSGDHIVISVANVSISQAGTANYETLVYYG